VANSEDVRESATQLLQKKQNESTVFSEEAENAVPKFNPHEVEHGMFLGQGGFCTVTELCDVILLRDEEPQSGSYSSFSKIQDRPYIAKNHQRDGQARYALKKISKELTRQGSDSFLAGVVDLAVEVKYLAIIQHPHIIKMRAISNAHPCSSDFFIMLDRLYDTLSDRIKGWKKEKRRTSGLGSLKDIKGKKKEEELGKRMVVAYDICSALNFMHKNNIIYRDLKPDNIGFDVRDDVKIFDLGLAAEMRPSARVDGTDYYKLTAESGSPRYMAPEVALGKPYNHLIDVYGFALLLWELCELKTPFVEHCSESLREKVFNGTERPPLNPKRNEAVNNLMKSSWHSDPSKRIECEDMMKMLKGEIKFAFGGDGVVFDSLDDTNKTAKSAEANGR